MRTRGSPAGTSPTIATPYFSRPRNGTATAARIVATSAAGTPRNSLGLTRRTRNVPSPTASVGQCVRPTFWANSKSRGTMPPAVIGNPKILPICPSMMLRAIPFRKPTSMGFERKSARAPNLKKLAPMHSTPASKASATDSDSYSFWSPEANGATAAATSAHVEASGPMINCREVPNIAYATSGRMLEYSPTAGLNPASCA